MRALNICSTNSVRDKAVDYMYTAAILREFAGLMSGL